jgi:hypothetical protein
LKSPDGGDNLTNLLPKWRSVIITIGRALLLLGVFAKATNAGAASCTIRAIRSVDTGNIIGYLVSGDKGSIIVENLSSAAAACRYVTAKPVVQV